MREKSWPGAGIGVEAQKEHRRMASLLCSKQRISFLSKKGARTFGWFQVLAIINTAAMNTGVYVSFGIWFSPDIGPEMGLQDHRVALFLVF